MFDTRNLSVLAYANGFTLWHYKSTDELGNIAEDDYFKEYNKIFCSNDFIMINAKDGNCMVAVTINDDKVITNKI